MKQEIRIKADENENYEVFSKDGKLWFRTPEEIVEITAHNWDNEGTSFDLESDDRAYEYGFYDEELDDFPEYLSFGEFGFISKQDKRFSDPDVEIWNEFYPDFKMIQIDKVEPLFEWKWGGEHNPAWWDFRKHHHQFDKFYYIKHLLDEFNSNSYYELHDLDSLTLEQWQKKNGKYNDEAYDCLIRLNNLRK